jgi:hypothetical protein
MIKDERDIPQERERIVALQEYYPLFVHGVIRCQTMDVNWCMVESQVSLTSHNRE